MLAGVIGEPPSDPERSERREESLQIRRILLRRKRDSSPVLAGRLCPATEVGSTRLMDFSGLVFISLELTPMAMKDEAEWVPGRVSPLEPAASLGICAAAASSAAAAAAAAGPGPQVLHRATSPSAKDGQEPK